MHTGKQSNGEYCVFCRLEGQPPHRLPVWQGSQWCSSGQLPPSQHRAPVPASSPTAQHQARWFRWVHRLRCRPNRLWWRLQRQLSISRIRPRRRRRLGRLSPPVCRRECWTLWRRPAADRCWTLRRCYDRRWKIGTSRWLKISAITSFINCKLALVKMMTLYKLMTLYTLDDDCCDHTQTHTHHFNSHFTLWTRVRAGFPRLLEIPGFFCWKFQDLESPGKSLWSWKVLVIKAWGPGKSWKNILESHAFFWQPKKKVMNWQFSVRSWTASSWNWKTSKLLLQSLHACGGRLPTAW